MPESGGKRFRIGYAFPAKKVVSFLQPSLVNHAADRGIDFIPIDPNSEPLLGEFDCIIHKLYGDDWRKNLEDFCLRSPSAVVVDPLASIEKLHNRITMLDVVAQLGIPGLGIPKQLLFRADSTSSLLEESMKFPVIAKAVVADGSRGSHQMSVVFNRDGLKELSANPTTETVLQEFVNHGGRMFKVYVAGGYVKCVKRNSLPDIIEETSKKAASDSGGILPFSQISNSAVAADLIEEEEEMPAPEFVARVGNALREALGLRLFNFDMIRPTLSSNCCEQGEKGTAGSEYLVIDINYFPGYEKLPSYETVMVDFFLDLLITQTNTGKE